jgi:hypothetical protein
VTAGAIFAAVLGLACVLASEIAADAAAPTRWLTRFASALSASVACGIVAVTFHITDPALVHEIAVIMFSLAPAALVLALIAAWEQPLNRLATAATLAVAAMAGAAAVAGAIFAGYAALFVSVCAILALSARHFHRQPRAASIAAGSAFALIAAASAMLSGKDNTMIALSTFSSAAIVGLPLACALKREHVAAKKISPQRHEEREGELLGA